MNRHFTDARYYARRTVEHVAKGIAEELSPVESRVRELTGREEEPVPTRLEAVRAELGRIEERAEGEAREAIGEARDQLRAYLEARSERVGAD